MRAIETIKNIWKIEDLRKRIITTILLVLVYRVGSYVVLPGIDPANLDALRNQTSKGLMQLLDMFSGGAFSNASIFALGIMPYITASIVIQLLGMVMPSFQKLQREGESGRTKLNQYTRYLTVIIRSRLLGEPESTDGFGLIPLRLVVYSFFYNRACCRQYVYHVAGRTYHRQRYR